MVIMRRKIIGWKFGFLVLLAGLLQGVNTHAQRIHFCDTTNRWVTVGYDSTSMAPVTSYYFYSRASYASPDGHIGDTAADGYFYFYLCDSAMAGSTLLGPASIQVREDTVTGMVYFLPSGSGFGVPLYNYNLLIGDTIHFTSFGYYGSSETDPIIDSAVYSDSVAIGSQHYRRMTLLEIDSHWHEFCGEGENRIYTVIEGLGSLSKPNAFMRCGFYEQLVCFSNSFIDSIPMNIAHPYPFATPFPNFSDTVYFTNDCASLSVPHVGAAQQESVVCYPDPANSQTVLRCSQVIHKGVLTVTDVLGRATSINIHDLQEIPIGALLQTGSISFYRLTDVETGKEFRGQVVRVE